MSREKIQEEVLISLEKNDYNGTVLALTGIGKGKIMVDVIKRLKPNSILYLCDNKDLRDKTFRVEMEKWGASEYIEKTEFVCYQTARKWEGREFDLLLADEIDFAVTPSYIKSITNNKFRFKICMSGTLSDDKRRRLNKIVPIIHEIGIQEAEDRRAINRSQVYFVPFNLSKKESDRYLFFNRKFKEILDKGNLTAHDKFKLKSLQLARKHFFSDLESLSTATRKLLGILYKDKNRKTLVFCGTTKQADTICRWSYHSKNESENYLEQFNNDLISVLAVVSKIDRGVNLKGVNTTVYASPTRSKTKTMQRGGRSRRLPVEQVADLFFMVPYYFDNSGARKPTVVYNYILESGEELDIKNAKTFNLC